MASRRIQHRYRDPLDVIWLRAAEQVGMRVERSDEVYASWDGRAVLTIARETHFDPDDCLAQMILHEICHALVAGDNRARVDWGLDNDDPKHLVFEHATHRLQAALSQPYGLREFMAVTTDWRPYWDALPERPLEDGADPAIPLAQRAYRRSRQAPFVSALDEALEATAKLAEAVRPFAEEASLWRRTRGRHVTGLLLGSEEHRCGDCAWLYTLRGNKSYCRRSKSAERSAVEISAREPACECWEPRLTADDCGSCGACCRGGFDLVQVRPREAFNKKHPELVSQSSLGLHVARPGGSCPALRGDGSTVPFRCAHYDDRPRACAEFPVAGDACLLARRRVGASR